MNRFRIPSSPLLHSLTATGCLALIASCGSLQKSEKFAPTASHLTAVQGNFDPRLGEAYSDVSDSYLAQSCLNLDENDVEFIPPQLGDLTVTQNASFDQLSDSLTAGGELSLNLAAFKANGSLQFANEMKSDAYSTTFMVGFNVKGGEYAIKQQGGSVTLNALGASAKADAVELNRLRKCGTRFVARKALAANFVAVLKFEFANKGQRDAFNGKLDLKISDIIEGSANVESTIDKVSESANITLKAVQIGGDASRLTGVIAQDLADCSSKNRGACKLAMAEILRYAKVDFPSQFKDPAHPEKVLPDRYATVAYDYASYDSVDPVWTAPSLSPEKAASLSLERRFFGELLLDEHGKYNRASALLRSGMKISALELEAIRGVQRVITDRVSLLSDAAQTCYTDNWVSCKTALDASKKSILLPAYYYDVTKLVIIPSDMGGWCAKLNQYGAVLGDTTVGASDAVAGTILTDEELYSLSKMFSALKPDGKTLDLNPQSTDATKMVVGKIDCSKVKFSVRDINADRVSLASQRLNNIDPLTSLAYTTDIDLSGNFIEDALPISKMRFLEILNLSRNRVKSLAGIRDTYLTTLNLSDNRLRNGDKDSANSLFREISGSTTLVTLNLSSNPALMDLKDLSNLPSLQTVDLQDTGINEASLVAFVSRSATDYPKLAKVQVTSSSLPDCVALSAQHQVIDCT